MFTRNQNSYYDGTKFVNQSKEEIHFVFNKIGEPLKELSITEIAQLLQNNKTAHNKFTNTFGEEDRILFPKQLQNHLRVLFEAIDIYNENM